MQWQIQHSSSKTLLEELSVRFPQQSGRTLRHWIQYGRLFCNGALVERGDFSLEEGDWLELRDWPKALKAPSFMKGSIAILYEDPHMLVIDKPTDLLSVAEDTRRKEHLFGLVKARYRDACVIHRLDAKTQGCIIFAKHREAGELLKTLLAEKLIRRRYMAIMKGRLEPEVEHFWSDFLFEDAAHHVHIAPQIPPSPRSASSRIPGKKEAKEAHMRLRVLDHSAHFSLVECELHTGRKHQIRVQASSRGHSILGDDRYGEEGKGEERKGRQGAKKESLALVAWQLSFPDLNPLLRPNERAFEEKKGEENKRRDEEGGEEQSEPVVIEQIKGWHEVTSAQITSFEERWQRLKKRDP